MIAAPALIYRTIALPADADRAVAHQRDACVATYGSDDRFQGAASYLHWLASKIEEFPDGFVLAFLGAEHESHASRAHHASDAMACIGQLELEVPYGSSVGYINLFYVSPEFRHQGFGRRLQEYAERYFRAWEARRIELHVSASNQRAQAFYRAMGYRVIQADDTGQRLWKMAKFL